MTIKRKINIALLIFGAGILLFIIFIVSPIFNQIKQESANLIAQKKGLLESEAKIENLEDFKNNFKQYEPNLKRIDALFINILEPVEFIEFLEKEADNSRLSIEISPPISKKENNDFWQALEFNLNLRGSFPNFLKFLERLESAPYLIKLTNASIRKIQDQKDVILATLSLKAYAK